MQHKSKRISGAESFFLLITFILKWKDQMSSQGHVVFFFFFLFPSNSCLNCIAQVK